jgi:hypothetical protein
LALSNIFKNYTDVLIVLVGKPTLTMYDSTDTNEFDDINRWVKANVMFEEVYDVYTSQLTKTKHYYRYGFRPTLELQIKIVNEDVLEKIDNLIEIINSDKFGDIIIVPNSNKDGVGVGEAFSLQNLKCVSDINPKEISESVRIGETLNLTFEGRLLLSAIPVLNRPGVSSDLVDGTGNSIVDESGDNLSAGI